MSVVNYMSPLKYELNTLEADRPQRDRPIACVIA
jgi:hypothetical protein